MGMIIGLLMLFTGFIAIIAGLDLAKTKYKTECGGYTEGSSTEGAMAIFAGIIIIIVGFKLMGFV